MSDIIIRPVTDIVGCQHFQVLEQMIWESPLIEVIPAHILITVLKNGGTLLGAYADDGPAETGGMVGAAFWWLGAGTLGGETEQRLKVCSHIAGVLPAWQGKRIGLRLKLAQREIVLDQGITDWITWTYDPLYRTNGIFNIHRLGATCNTYFRDVYGEMQDILNRGVPSDRCQVDWWLNSEHVLADIEPQRLRPGWTFTDFQILPTVEHGPFRAPVELDLRPDGTPIALPLPDDISAIRAADNGLSLDWRLYQRSMLESAFAAGYTMVDCVQIPARGWHYVLVQEYG